MKLLNDFLINKIYKKFKPLVEDNIINIVKSSQSEDSKDYYSKAEIIGLLKNTNFISNYDLLFEYPEKGNKTKKQEILRRTNFYLHKPKIKIISHLETRKKNYLLPIIYTNESINKITDVVSISGTYNVDYENDPNEGVNWHSLAMNISNFNQNDLIKKYHKLFIKKLKHLDQKKRKVYLFGTGPTLSKYKKYYFNDGISIFCNTTVKDKTIWNDINPDYIVAADTIFHFGPSEYAIKFRNDLKQRLKEHVNTSFCYPLLFHTLVSRELKEYENQLLPIPVNDEYFSPNPNLSDNFFLPNTGNILKILMLPLACTISKNINLFGFDGKKPGDKLFWRHSQKHDYSKLIPGLVKMHPAFFNNQLPNNDKNKYIRETMGNELDQQLTDLEKQGWQFHMMHKSTNPVLNKRFRG